MVPGLLSLPRYQAAQAGGREHLEHHRREEPAPQPAAWTGRGGGDDDEQLFERFFGQREMPEELKGPSLGSGFVINSEGYVLTNNHVVEDETDIKVRLADGRELAAKVVGRDAGTDVALLKLEKVEGKLPTVALGDSDALEQGDFVLAIGSPLGFRESATFGIVSAKDRQLTGSASTTFSRPTPPSTRATRWPARQHQRGGNRHQHRDHLPADRLRHRLRRAHQPGEGGHPPAPQGEGVTRILGVTVSELTPDFVQGFGLAEGTKGALVQAVLPKSPAAKAGLQAGDVVVAVNGKPIDTAGQLTRLVAAKPPGGKATLSLLHGKDRKEVQVLVGQRPDEESIARGDVGPEQGGDDQNQGSQNRASDKLGVRVAPLTAQTVRDLSLASNQGVLVVAVTPDGPAATAGIRRNDVLLELNRQALTGIDQLRTLIGKMKTGQVVVLRVARGDSAEYVTVKLGGDKQ